MTWVAVAVAGSAIVGGAMSAEGAKDAAAAQSGAAGQAGALSDQQYKQSRSDLAPYRNAGGAAVNRIRELLGLETSAQDRFDADAYLRANPDVARNGMDPYQHFLQFGRAEGRLEPTIAQQPGMSVGDLVRQDPSYQFRFDEGQRALRNIAGARGVLNSGQTAKEMTQYGQNLASTEYGNIYNRLANVAGMGQGAVNTGVGAGANYAGTVGGYMTGAGNARGASAIGQANAYGGAINTVGNYYAQQQTLDKIMNRGGYGGYGGGSPY